VEKSDFKRRATVLAGVVVEVLGGKKVNLESRSLKYNALIPTIFTSLTGRL
jgi:hypothetical protein